MPELIRAFEDKIFEAVTMTEKVNRRPYRPNFLQSLGIFQEMPIFTPTFAMTNEEGKLTLLPTVDRRAPLPDWKPTVGEVRTFTTTRVGEGSTITVDELMPMLSGVDTMSLKTLAEEVTRRQQGLEDDLNVTEEHMELGAVQGIVIDADGTREIANWFDGWSVTPATEIAMDFGNANTDVEAIALKIKRMKREMIDSQKGLRWNGQITALVGAEFAEKLFFNKEILKLHEGLASNVGRAEDNVAGYDERTLFGIRWVEYRGLDAGSPLNIADNEAKLFPSDPSSQIFRMARAPAPTFKDEFRGQAGLRRYAFRDIDPNDRQEWVRFELETYPMPVCMRPEMLRTMRAGA